MTLNEWCCKWRISPEAILELAQPMRGSLKPGMSEAGVQQRVRLLASNQGMHLWRNNVGAMIDDNGRPIRFGLLNDSAQLNRKIKSSDLIGIAPGGRFVAIEVKKSNWTYRGTDREQAQLRFLSLVNAMGGIGYFSTGGLIL